jgi:hypothetical protein
MAVLQVEVVDRYCRKAVSEPACVMDDCMLCSLQYSYSKNQPRLENTYKINQLVTNQSNATDKRHGSHARQEVHLEMSFWSWLVEDRHLGDRL